MMWCVDHYLVRWGLGGRTKAVSLVRSPPSYQYTGYTASILGTGYYIQYTGRAGEGPLSREVAAVVPVHRIYCQYTGYRVLLPVYRAGGRRPSVVRLPPLYQYTGCTASILGTGYRPSIYRAGGRSSSLA